MRLGVLLGLLITIGGAAGLLPRKYARPVAGIAGLAIVGWFWLFPMSFNAAGREYGCDQMNQILKNLPTTTTTIAPPRSQTTRPPLRCDTTTPTTRR